MVILAPDTLSPSPAPPWPDLHVRMLVDDHLQVRHHFLGQAVIQVLQMAWLADGLAHGHDAQQLLRCTAPRLLTAARTRLAPLETAQYETGQGGQAEWTEADSRDSRRIGV